MNAQNQITPSPQQNDPKFASQRQLVIISS